MLTTMKRKQPTHTRVYELPFGKGKKFGNTTRASDNQAIGGWAISPDLTIHGGFPLALYNNGSDQTGTLLAACVRTATAKNTVLRPARRSGPRWRVPVV